MDCLSYILVLVNSIFIFFVSIFYSFHAFLELFIFLFFCVSYRIFLMIDFMILFHQLHLIELIFHALIEFLSYHLCRSVVFCRKKFHKFILHVFRTMDNFSSSILQHLGSWSLMLCDWFWFMTKERLSRGHNELP